MQFHCCLELIGFFRVKEFVDGLIIGNTFYNQNLLKNRRIILSTSFKIGFLKMTKFVNSAYFSMQSKLKPDFKFLISAVIMIVCYRFLENLNKIEKYSSFSVTNQQHKFGSKNCNSNFCTF